jgi:hypothetical protein
MTSVRRVAPWLLVAAAVLLLGAALRLDENARNDESHARTQRAAAGPDLDRARLAVDAQDSAVMRAEKHLANERRRTQAIRRSMPAFLAAAHRAVTTHTALVDLDDRLVTARIADNYAEYNAAIGRGALAGGNAVQAGIDLTGALARMEGGAAGASSA